MTKEITFSPTFIESTGRRPEAGEVFPYLVERYLAHRLCLSR